MTPDGALTLQLEARAFFKKAKRDAELALKNPLANKQEQLAIIAICDEALKAIRL